MSKRVLTRGMFRSFHQFLSMDAVYIDKTAPLCELARHHGSFVLARPRCIGKTTLVSTLEYLFSKGTEGTEGLACHELWDDPYRYIVLHLYFAPFNVSSAEDFKRSVIARLLYEVEQFGISINAQLDWRTFFETLVREILAKLADQSFLEQHPELLQGDRPLCTDKIVLLVDEYDSPLTHCLDNEKLFSELSEAYRSFFAALNGLSSLRFVLMIGVRSYTQTPIFSDAPQFQDVSLDDKYATCCGYTPAEIDRFLQPEFENAQEVLKLTHDELMDRLTYHYGGYRFTTKNDNSKGVLFPLSVSSLLQDPKDGFDSYWILAAARSTLVVMTLRQLSLEVMETLLQKLVFPNLGSDLLADDYYMDEINRYFPNLSLDLDSQDSDASDILTVEISSLAMSSHMTQKLSVYEAVVALYQGGLLSIASTNGDKAILTIPNHKVSWTIMKILIWRAEAIIGPFIRLGE